MLLHRAAAVKHTGQKAGSGGAAPGCLWAAQDVRDVIPAAVGERVDASSELPRDLLGRRAQTTVSTLSGRGFRDIYPCHKHLAPSRSRLWFLTCSLVVLPLATKTMWKPVSPATGMKNRPATHMTASLRSHSQEDISSRRRKKRHWKLNQNSELEPLKPKTEVETEPELEAEPKLNLNQNLTLNWNVNRNQNLKLYNLKLKLQLHLNRNMILNQNSNLNQNLNNFLSMGTYIWTRTENIKR